MRKAIAISPKPTLGEIILELFRSLQNEEKAAVKEVILNSYEDWDILTKPMREWAAKNSLREKDLLKSVMRDRYGKD